MADIPLHLEQLRGKITESLFQKALENTHRLNIITAQLNIIPDKTKFAGKSDNIGLQQSGRFATAPLASLEYTLYSDSPTLTRMAYGTIKQNDLNILSQGSIQKTWATDTARNKNVIFSWDSESIKNISFRGIKGPGLLGSESSPIVPVKALARHFFPDLNQIADNSKIESLSHAVMTAGPEDLAGSSSLRYLTESYGMFGKPILKMNTAEQVEAVRNAVFMKAEAEGKLPELRQLLYYKGVKNMEGINALPYNPEDRFGAGRVFENAIKPNSLGGYYTDFAKGADINPFLKKVEHFYGEEYAQNKLRPFLTEIFGKSGSEDIGVLLGEGGELFMGKSGLKRSFVPLPAQVVGSSITEAGLQPGRLWFKGFRNSRNIVTSSDGTFKAVPAIDTLLSSFKQGLYTEAGLQPGTEEIALTFARNKVSKNIENLVTSVQERGQPALLPTAAINYSAFDDHTFKESSDALRELMGAVGSQGDVRGLSEAYKRASQNLVAAGGVDPGLFYAAKAKEKVVALHDLAKFILPGSTTENEIVKGVGYQHRPLEITSPSQVAKIQSVSEHFLHKAGVSGSASIGSPGMTEGEFEALVRTEKEYKGVVGAALGVQGRQVYSKYSMPIAYLGGYNKLEERTLMGDPGVELTAVGRQVYQDVKRPTAAFKVQMSKKQMHEVFSALAEGDLSKNPELEKVFDLVSNGQRWMSSDGIKISKEGYFKARKRVKDIFGKTLPDKAMDLTLANVSEFDNMVTLAFASEGSPGAVSTLVSNKRATMFQGTDRYPEISNLVGGISGKEMLSSINKGQLIYEHYTGLSSYLPGKQEQFFNLFQEEAKKRGYSSDLIKLGKTESGELKIISESLKHKDNLNYVEQFEKAGRAALLRGGIPRGVIHGKARSWAKFLGESTDFLTDEDRVFISEVKERVAQTADIMNQKHSFRIRLDMMRRWARTMEETTGIKPKDNPLFMKLANFFQRETGTVFSEGFLAGDFVPVNSIFKKLPSNLTGFAAAIKGESKIKDLGLPIISEEQAIKTFVTGPHGISLSQETTTGEYLTSSLKKSALFNPDVRPEEYKKGVFVKLNRPSRVPLRAQASAIGQGVDDA